jgi:rubrerythrin
MDGGIRAWQGLTADGPPEGGVAYFASGTSAADMAALAWALEENTRQYYMTLAKEKPGTKEADLFTRLVSAEEHHKETLESTHNKMSTESVSRFHRTQDAPVLEGGISIEEALAWAANKPAREILVASMGLEANAYDRYLKMVDMAEGEEAREVFRKIAKEEKGHLRKLSRLLDEVVQEDN